MREFDSKNQLWFQDRNNLIEIGFTKSFLEGLEQCWHILPAHNERFKSKSPLLTIETNEQMFSLMSPVNGFLNSYSPKAQNFPEKLTEDDVVISLSREQPAVMDNPPIVDPVAILRGVRSRLQAEQDAIRAGGEPARRFGARGANPQGFEPQRIRNLPDPPQVRVGDLDWEE